MSNQIFLSSTDTAPMYTQIMDYVMTKVLAGDWPPGQAMPSIRELASTSRVSVITVKRAYLELERAGVIITRHGIGSFVADTQELPRHIAQEEFDSHLLGMLHAASKLSMPVAAVVSAVRNTMEAAAAAAPAAQKTTVKRG